MFEPLGKLIRLEYGQALPAEKRTGYGYPVFGSNGVVGHHEPPLITGPGIVIGRKGSVGKVAWSETSFWPIDTTYYVESHGCEISWAYRVLDWLPLQDLDTSTGVPGLNRNDVYEISVFVPCKNEQAVIARALDTLDTQIQKTEALIAKLEKVKEGLLHDLLTRGIDANGRLRPSPERAPELYKKSPLGLIPREWRYGQLKDFGQLISGQHIPGELSNRDGRGVPYFTGPTDFYSGKTVTSSHTEFPQSMCSMGDLLITVKGSGCGKTAIAATDACISRQLMAFSFKETEKGFWRAFFSSNEKMINKIAEGGAIPGISRRQLLHIPAACPKTEYEFIAISEIIVEHEKRQLSEERQLKKLIKQKSGLMDDLLTGRVRVTPLLDKAQATTPA